MIGKRRREHYIIGIQKAIVIKGYNMIGYILKPEDPDNWVNFNLFLGEKGEYIGCQISSKTYFFVFMNKK
jgi:hypothetical protein